MKIVAAVRRGASRRAIHKLSAIVDNPFGQLVRQEPSAEDIEQWTSAPRSFFSTKKVPGRTTPGDFGW
ncbi:hypothetical protein C0Z17_17645 [Trinickia caryophylli]|nr:hypothetical protein C0Z17_17645 [Trinickia caryophylli]